ncbi:DUF5709 domain-containing protein [Georgenia faecalis]|uniref:DUF5709 domain-containing protein n=1 Tax=Georgenia faecalis TaxID=2483799 RepID=A0ABV9D835_9MICO|nr:DUF5709 domain-containing protein [Georgenia faecalis]
MSENDMSVEPDTSEAAASMDTTADTSATRQDPSLAGEGDTDQLQKEEMLVERGVDDLADEGVSPPERDPLRGLNLTPREQVEGDTLAERLEQEQPEVWEEAGDQPLPDRQPDRAGRLEALPDDDDPTDTVGEAQSSWAADVGVAGGAATAEEAAMHIVDEDEAPGLTGLVDEGGTPG